MFSILFSYYLSAHLLGEFYLKPQRLAENRTKRLPMLLADVVLYSLPLFAAAAVFFGWASVLYTAIIPASHLVILMAEYGAAKLSKRKEDSMNLAEKHPPILFIINQGLHIAAICAVCYLLAQSKIQFGAAGWVIAFYQVTAVNVNLAVRWLLVLLLIGKPANVLFAKLFSTYKPLDKELEKGKKAGALIGTLERIVIVLFMSIAQYSAVGLILTAKSIARYNRISEDKEFGEYYLLGTLASVLYAVAVFLLLF